MNAVRQNDRLQRDATAERAGIDATQPLDAQASQLNDLSAEELLDAAQTIFRPENLSISVERNPDLVTEDMDKLFAELRNML